MHPHLIYAEYANGSMQVARAAPDDFWKFSLALFKKQGEYFDIPSSTMTPLQIREKLVALVEESVGADKAAQVKDLLALKSTPNGGTAVTDDLKYTSAWHNSLCVSGPVILTRVVLGWHSQIR